MSPHARNLVNSSLQRIIFHEVKIKLEAPPPHKSQKRRRGDAKHSPPTGHLTSPGPATRFIPRPDFYSK